MTLLELMITVVILSVAGLGLVGAFSYISKAVQVHRTVTLATNLNQQQIEVLKDENYFQVIPTSAPGYNNNFSPAIPYDTAIYPPANVTIGNASFQVLTYVERVLSAGGNLMSMPPDSLDTGLKRITITTVWQLGTQWYERSLTNLLASSQYSNTGGFTGTVTDATTGLPIQGADVYARSDTLFHDWSDNNGKYVMSATPGTFNLSAQAPGYLRDAPATNYVVTAGNIVTANLQLTPMAVGSVSGSVYVNNNIVISQVVASSVQANTGFDVQYVELYNPTTFQMVIGSTASQNVQLNFDTEAGYSCSNLALTYSKTTINSYGYYLIANTGTFVVGGTQVNADATYSNAASDGSIPAPGCSGGGLGACTGGGQYRVPCAGHSGAVYLTNTSGNTIDAVGWTDGGTSPANCNGNCYPLATGGLPRANQLERMTSTGTAVSTQGNAYNTDENNLNFVYNAPISQGPRTSSSSNTPISGFPAYGAVITSNDGLSASATAYQTSVGGFHYATFTLVDIATGTWTVEISTGLNYLEISSVSVLTNGAAAVIPSSATSPAWPASGVNNAVLSLETSSGIISGQVTDPNGVPLSGITITVEPETTGTTNSAGFYNIATGPGTYSVAANSGNTNTSYSSQQLAGIVVLQGQINNGNNFVLSGAGRANGYVCNYTASNAYPGITINTLDMNGNSASQVVSVSNGKFIVNNLSTGAYTFETVLDLDQTASAAANGTCTAASGAISCQVTAGANINIGTFTITGAYGVIAGTATASTAPITTGVLIVATTGTITGSLPPNLSSATLLGAPYYMISTLSNGTYNLSVRASTASDTFNLYGWYTTYNGSTPVTKEKSQTVNVTGGQTSWSNLGW